MGRYRVSMDIGGHVHRRRRLRRAERARYAAGKASTTPHDLTEGVFEGACAGRRLARRDRVLRAHGTTVGPERLPAAARASVCCCSPPRARATSTTIARGNRPTALRPALPQAARRSSRAATSIEIPGRLDYTATELDPLDEARVRAAGRRARATRASAPSPSAFSSPTSIRPTSCAPRRSCARSSRIVPISLSHRVARRVARVRAHLLRCPRRLHGAASSAATSSA